MKTLSCAAILCLSSPVFCQAEADEVCQQSVCCDYVSFIEGKESSFEIGFELLFLTSTISSVFSDAQRLLDETFGPDVSAIIYKNNVASLDPDYKLGFTAFMTYRPCVSLNAISLTYHYIPGEGDGRLKEENSVSIPSALLDQTVMQSDKGSEKMNLHIGTLSFDRTLPINPFFLLNLRAGFSFHYFDYRMNAKNILNLQQFELGTSTVLGIQDVDFSTHQKTKFYGVGPSLGLEFRYSFFCPESCQDLYVVGMANGGMICVRDSLEGSLDLTDELLLNGLLTTSNTSISWENSKITHFIPHVDLDFRLEYACHQFCTECLSLDLALGYRLFSYWNVDETGRRICDFDSAREIALQDLTIQSRDIEEFAFCGPYLKVGFGF